MSFFGFTQPTPIVPLHPQDHATDHLHRHRYVHPTDLLRGGPTGQVATERKGAEGANGSIKQLVGFGSDPSSSLGAARWYWGGWYMAKLVMWWYWGFVDSNSGTAAADRKLVAPHGVPSFLSSSQIGQGQFHDRFPMPNQHPKENNTKT